MTNKLSRRARLYTTGANSCHFPTEKIMNAQQTFRDALSTYSWSRSVNGCLTGETENARHKNSAQRKLQGVENAGLENAAQKMQGWKMRNKSV